MYNYLKNPIIIYILKVVGSNIFFNHKFTSFAILFRIALFLLQNNSCNYNYFFAKFGGEVFSVLIVQDIKKLDIFKKAHYIIITNLYDIKSRAP